MTSPLSSNSVQTSQTSITVAASNLRSPLSEIQSNRVFQAQDNSNSKTSKTLKEYAWSLVDNLLKQHKDSKNIVEATKKMKEEVEKGIALFEAHAKKQNKDPIFFSAMFAKNVFALSATLFDKE